jgi:hypothetical protein
MHRLYKIDLGWDLVQELQFVDPCVRPQACSGLRGDVCLRMAGYAGRRRENTDPQDVV